MKCVCLMGGDRTCPDDCPQVVWNSLPPKKRNKAARQAYAEKLYKNKATMEQIAAQLGVNKSQISRDLELLHDATIKKPTKTASNPKGAGRPKGSRAKSKLRKNDTVAAAEAARLVLDLGVSHEKAGAETGVGHENCVRMAVAREEGRREAEATITPDMLSLTAQEKLESAIRQHKRKLDAEHTARMHNLNEEVRQRVLDEGKEYLATLREMRDKVEDDERWYRTLINDRKPPFTADEYRTILMCIHPDGERTPTKLHSAFVLLESKKEILTGEQKKKRIA